ncbi:class I glutamine amidotransferase-like protein [Aspergillus ambiguus]|uniref:class I glutamine amidotransferase-like protein n=1 Tax=Aspergillus ambiguus TaxID=176160 RepID=UPI003CCD9E8D
MAAAAVIHPPSARQSALALIYPGFNALEVTGPAEVFFNVGCGVTIAASDDLTTSQENFTFQRSLHLDDARKRLSEFDILIVPGSRSRNILPHLGPPLEGDKGLTGIMQLIRDFVQTAPLEGHGERAILAGALGSYLLGAAGVLNGLSATTHRLVAGTLRHICAKSHSGQEGAGTDVVPESASGEAPLYVDAGCNDAGVRVITVTGPSTVIDATLSLVARWKGRPAAEEAAMFLGHSWREV